MDLLSMIACIYLTAERGVVVYSSPPAGFRAGAAIFDDLSTILGVH
jgi:hypothetical protein